jgi:hypothetical protein
MLRENCERNDDPCFIYYKSPINPGAKLKLIIQSNYRIASTRASAATSPEAMAAFKDPLSR